MAPQLTYAQQHPSEVKTVARWDEKLLRQECTKAKVRGLKDIQGQTKLAEALLNALKAKPNPKPKLDAAAAAGAAADGSGADGEDARKNAEEAAKKAKAAAALLTKPQADTAPALSEHAKFTNKAIADWSVTKAPADPNNAFHVYGLDAEEASHLKGQTKYQRLVAKYFRRITADIADAGSQLLAVWLSPFFMVAATLAYGVKVFTNIKVPPVVVLEMKKVVDFYEDGDRRTWSDDIGRQITQHVVEGKGSPISDFFFRLSEEDGSSEAQHHVLTALVTGLIIGHQRHARFPLKNTQGLFAAALMQAEARDVPAANAYLGEMAKDVFTPDPTAVARGLGTPPTRPYGGRSGNRAISPVPHRDGHNGPFRGRCYNCDRVGHTRHDCPDADKPSRRRQRGGGAQQSKRPQPKKADEE